MLNNRTESDARQYPSRSNNGKKKGNSVKWSRKSIIFSPFCYRVSYFLVNIFATREPASLSKGLAAIKMAIRGQMEFLRNDYFGTVILRDPKTSPWPAGSNYRAVSWHRFNFPAKYTGDVYLANCLFQTCISVHVEVLQKHSGISIESNWGVRGIENREYMIKWRKIWFDIWNNFWWRMR